MADQVTIGNELRIGGADVFIYAYGNGFTTSVHSILDLHEDGLTYTPEAFERLVRSGRTPGIIDSFDFIEALTFEVLLPVHTMESIALSLGQPLTSVVEVPNATPPPPPRIQVDVGSSFVSTYYEVEIKAPQPATPTLFDVIQMYKARFKAVFNQQVTIQQERYIPLKVMAVKDPANSNNIFRIYSEGV